MNTIKKGILKGIDYESPLVQYRARKVLKIASLLTNRSVDNININLAVDLYYIFYLPAPVVNEDSRNEFVKLFVDPILNTTNGSLIRSKTILDSFKSLLSASIYLLKITEKAYSKTPVDSIPQTETSPTREEIDGLLKSMGDELDRIFQLRSIAEGLLPGSSSTDSIEEYSIELLRLAHNADIRKLLEVLKGIKYGDLSERRKHRYTRRGEKTGYELGNDLERIAPRSIVLDDDLFYFKLVEGRLLLYKKSIEEASGPIYILIDKSGSMEGDKMLWAKTLGLALYMRSVKELRELFLRFFDSQPHRMVKLSKGVKIRDVTSLLEYVARIRNAGGTDITRALLTALSDINKLGLRDCSIILISDGIDRVSLDPIRRELSKAKSRLYTVMIKGDNQSLRAISDGYFHAVKLDNEEILRVIKMIK
ncbi:MAG: VWA domain-containing protein [Desulfurococcaceae archaeon]